MPNRSEFFDDDFCKAYAIVKEKFQKSLYFPTIFNITDDGKFNQAIGEYTLGFLLFQKLQALGWQCKLDPMGFSGTFGNKNIPDEWHYYKQGKNLLVIMGDGVCNYPHSLFDYVITDSFQYNEGQEIMHLDPEIYGLYDSVLDYQYSDDSTSRLFNCFMSTPSISRQCWFYELYRRDLLDQGYVTYLVNSKNQPSMARSQSEIIADFDSYLHNPVNEVFVQQHDYLRTQLPFKNFNLSLEQAIANSKISLVIETEYVNTEQTFLTEKTFRALLMPRPYMIFVPGYKVGIIDYLRSLGFETHDDIVDHGYDTRKDPVPRIGLMLDSLDRLKGMDFNAIQGILRDRANHNRNIVANFRSKLSNKYHQCLDFILSIS